MSQSAMWRPHNLYNLDDKQAQNICTSSSGWERGRSISTASYRSGASAATSTADTEWDIGASEAIQEQEPELPGPSSAEPIYSVPEEALWSDEQQENLWADEQTGGHRRFMDILENSSDGDGDEPQPDSEPTTPRTPTSISAQSSWRSEAGRGQSWTPVPVEAPASPELSAEPPQELGLGQRITLALGRAGLLGLDFNLTIADASRPGCPLSVCSDGFLSLVGHSDEEALGSSAASRLSGIVHDADAAGGQQRNEVARLLARAEDSEYHSPGSDCHPGSCLLAAAEPGELPLGELVLLQTHARPATGESFRCVTWLKQVELEEEMFVIALLAPVPDMTWRSEEEVAGGARS